MIKAKGKKLMKEKGKRFCPKCKKEDISMNIPDAFSASQGRHPEWKCDSCGLKLPEFPFKDKVKIDCIFCKIVNGKIPAIKVYEDSKVLAFMDIKPVNEGHVLVIPKKHTELLVDLDDDLVSHLFKKGKNISKKIRESGIKCEGINFFVADGESAGQEVFHVHLHLIPRFKGDGFGFTFPKNYGRIPSSEEREKTAQKIRGNK